MLSRPAKDVRRLETGGAASRCVGPPLNDAERRHSLQVVRPETVVGHRQGFKRYWAWKSRRRSGRPTIRAELRELIWRMSRANPLWGAPRIHGELLKLGL